jgi:uncharacterized protein YdiU (UPF0061 family)
MNTDNMAISGETIDYGPCAFMDIYDPAMVFSSIDRQGRYAFGNQPAIAQWNLARLAETLLPLLDNGLDRAVSLAEGMIESFSGRFNGYWLSGMRKKLGLHTQEEADDALIGDLLKYMHQAEADYTLTFRLLCGAADEKANNAPLKEVFAGRPDFDGWMPRWHARLVRQAPSSSQCADLMRSVNPACIPRNHRVEQAIEAAVERNDFSVTERLMQALSRPYEEQEEYAEYALAPLLSERVQETFCGT